MTKISSTFSSAAAGAGCSAGAVVAGCSAGAAVVVAADVAVFVFVGAAS
ncbi:hypothetical protein L6R52_02275 [Myxococcota bacterium]|nr:hypothetical protein [Myxococcota bacterium]